MSYHVHIDFETRSACDLKKEGLYRYAEDPTTEVLCMAVAAEDDDVELWGYPYLKLGMIPPVISNAVEDDAIFYAHNAPFEIEIWNKVLAKRFGWPRLDYKRTRCTMAMAYAMALPGSLDQASAALGLVEGKDAKGHRLMMQMSKPRKVEDDGTIVWWDDEDRFERLYNYCKQDVVVERMLSERLLDLSDSEQKLWLMDHEINQRGISVDRALCRKFNAVVEATGKHLNDEMRRMTNGQVSAVTNVHQLTDWVRFRGIETSGMAKADVASMLEDESLPKDVRRALEIRQEGGKTSTAKLNKMLSVASEDGRVRGCLQYHGAGTGRWAGRHIQTQNLPRPIFGAKAANHICDMVHKTRSAEKVAAYMSAMYDAPLDVVSSCLRAVICAPEGKTLVAGDFASIEARMLAWMAGEQWVLDVFAGDGKMYERNAAAIFGLPLEQVDKDSYERFVGKVAELALGYQGGVGAFQQMARSLGSKFSDEFADEVKVAWRSIRPSIVKFWKDIEYVAIQALKKKGQAFSAGYPEREVTFKASGSFLWCQLPSKRVLCYPYAKLVDKETPWGSIQPGVRYKSVNQKNRKWEWTDTYGGKLTENVVQAACRDLLAEAMQGLEQAGYPVVFHVHDEAVCELDIQCHNKSVDENFRDIMTRVPSWAAGLPVDASVWSGKRYRK